MDLFQKTQITKLYECGPAKVLTGLVKKRFRDIEVSPLSDYGVDTLNSNGIEGHLLEINSKDTIEHFWTK